MRGVRFALIGVAALAGCGQRSDFDARYANQAAGIEASANRMQGELARQIELANGAEAIITQLPGGEATDNGSADSVSRTEKR